MSNRSENLLSYGQSFRKIYPKNVYLIKIKKRGNRGTKDLPSSKILIGGHIGSNDLVRD